MAGPRRLECNDVLLDHNGKCSPGADPAFFVTGFLSERSEFLIASEASKTNASEQFERSETTQLGGLGGL